MDKLTKTYKAGYGYGLNKGTWVTHDNGKTWDYISDKIMEQVSIGMVTISKKEDGIYRETPEVTEKIFDDVEAEIYTYNNKFYIKTNEELYVSEDGKHYEIEVVGDAKFDDRFGRYGNYDIKEVSYKSDEKITVDGTEDDDKINVLLLYALNSIFLPQITFEVTGSPVFKEGEFYSDDPRQENFIIDDDRVYRYSDFSSLINWQEDVGMFPFEGITFKDLISNDVHKVGERTFKLNTNKKLEKAMNQVKRFYAARKNEALMYVANQIKKVEPDPKYIAAIREADYPDDQERINALETYAEYILGAKGGSIEIYNKFVEAVHFLDDYKVKTVINAAIYETTKELAPKIRGRIYDTSVMARKLERILEVKLDDITWNYEKSLYTVYTKYQKYINKNILRFSENSDKKVIRVAALNYRTELKEKYLEELNKKLLSISLYDELKGHYSDKINELENYESGQEEPNVELPEDFENFYLDRLYIHINYILNTFKPVFFDNDPNYLELEEEERKRAMRYAEEIFDMFKTRVKDYFVYMRKKGALHFTPNNDIKTKYINWKQNGGIKPNWKDEFKRLDVLARDSTVYVFISEEDKI